MTIAKTATKKDSTIAGHTVAEDDRKTGARLQTARIPEQKYLQTYIGRVLPGGKTEMDTFAWHDAQHDNILVEGPTGPGKTSAIMAYAVKTKKKFYSVPSNVGIEPSQLFGKYIPDGKGGFMWIDGPVTTLVREGGVLLINEVNMVPERVASVLFALLDRRREITLLEHRGEVIDAHKDLVIFCDMNPDYEGTRPLNKAFRNRFAAQIFWDYDPKVEAQLVGSAVLRNMANKIRTQIATGAFETPLSTNMLMEFERISLGLGYDYAVSNFVNHFNTDEREAMKTLVGTFRGTLEPSVRPPETEDEKYERRRRMAENEVDVEWGVKGVDWVWEDEELPENTEDEADEFYEEGGE